MNLSAVQAGALSVLLLASAPAESMAQTVSESAPPVETGPIGRVIVDLAAHTFDRTLPFDIPFFITGVAPEGTRSLEVQYAAVPKSGDTASLQWLPGEPVRWQPSGASTTDQHFLVLMRTPLEAGHTYQVRFAFRNERTVETLTADGRTGGKNYVSVDAGVLYAGDLAIGALYVGSNIYFRPVNKAAPLSSVSSLGRRLALTVGLTISSVADENNRTRSDLFWHQSLVLGGGYRLTSSVRGGAGALLFRQSDPNPLVTRKTAAVTWYVSFSFDLDLLKGFAG